MKAILLALALLPGQDDPVRKLVERLGSDDPAEREQATKDLVKIGRKALPLLEEAARSGDVERAARANEAIRRITKIAFRGGDLFAGRRESKGDSVLQAGGGRETEDAVLHALKWLSRHQGADGSWGARTHVEECGKHPRYAGGSCEAPRSVPEDFDAGVTGLAVLAFTGAGFSHLSKDTYDGVSFGDVVRKGVQWIMSKQDPEGCLASRNAQKYMYSHATAALALAEAYAMSGSRLLVDQAQKAADFTVAAQNRGKGWRYSFRCGDNDTSVTFWAAWGLFVARKAGLRVPDAALEGARAWVEEVTEEAYGRVGYTHKGTGKVFVPGLNENFDHHESLTAMGALVRMAAGGRLGEPQVTMGLDLLLRDKPSWGRNSTDFYYWHLGTMAMFQHDGPEGRRWKAWNEDVKKALIENQRLAGAGCETGSWAPVGRWCGEGGRVYATAINALTLETYYRYRLVAPP